MTPFLRPALVIIACLALGGVEAAENPGTKQLQELTAAFAGNDAGAKKTAARALADKSVGSNTQVVPLLVGLVDDRQAGDAVVAALVARTGAAIPKYGRPGPGIDPAKVKAAWQTWLTEWQEKQKLAAVEKKLKDDEAAAKKKAKDEAATKNEDKEGEKKPDAPTEDKTLPPPPQDLGKPDRIIFKTGGSLVCYVQSRRVDADGNLVSVRVVHPDGGGEETLSAELISRIEEDIP